MELPLPAHPGHAVDFVEDIRMTVVHADVGGRVHYTLDDGAKCKLCSRSKHSQGPSLVRKYPVVGTHTISAQIGHQENYSSSLSCPPCSPLSEPHKGSGLLRRPDFRYLFAHLSSGYGIIAGGYERRYVQDTPGGCLSGRRTYDRISYATYAAWENALRGMGEVHTPFFSGLSSMSKFLILNASVRWLS